MTTASVEIEGDSIDECNGKAFEWRHQNFPNWETCSIQIIEHVQKQLNSM